VIGDLGVAEPARGGDDALAVRVGRGQRLEHERVIHAWREARSAPRAQPATSRRPSAEALVLADGVWGHRKRAARAEHARALDGPPEAFVREAERESARAGRRGLGASEARSACGARASTGRAPRAVWGEAERESAHAGRRGLGASEQRSARSARAADGPPGLFDGLAASLYGWAVDS